LEHDLFHDDGDRGRHWPGGDFWSAAVKLFVGDAILILAALMTAVLIAQSVRAVLQWMLVTQ
jgi:hypothetical protein